jgi:hypothetical protein
LARILKNQGVIKEAKFLIHMQNFLPDTSDELARAENQYEIQGELK